MAKFTDEDKVEKVFNNNYFGEGIFKVQIVSVKAGETDKGSEYFEFELVGEGGEEGNARVYFTEKAKPYSFNTIRAIFVHNAVNDAAKEKTRKAIDAVKDTDELLKLCEALRGKECWLLVEKTGEKYTSKSNGREYDQLNKNIYGYEPKMKNVSDATAVINEMGGGEITPENVEDVFPFE
jgi:hypothetical protein